MRRKSYRLDLMNLDEACSRQAAAHPGLLFLNTPQFLGKRMQRLSVWPADMSSPLPTRPLLHSCVSLYPFKGVVRGSLKLWKGYAAPFLQPGSKL